MVNLAEGDVFSLPDASGVTSLMYACAYGNEMLVQYLLKKVLVCTYVCVRQRDFVEAKARTWLWLLFYT